MSTFENMKSRRDEIFAIAAKHGAANIRIFGSVARGEDRHDSDVDFLVDMGRDRSLYDLVGLQQDIESLLGRKADVLTSDSLHPRLKDRVLAEALPCEGQGRLRAAHLRVHSQNQNIRARRQRKLFQRHRDAGRR